MGTLREHRLLAQALVLCLTPPCHLRGNMGLLLDSTRLRWKLAQKVLFRRKP